MTICPICNKYFKDRIRIHIINTHGIRDPAATAIKNLCISLEYAFTDEKPAIAEELKNKLAENGFRFEKLRTEA